MTREECCAVVAEKDMPRTVYDMIVAMQEKYAERPAFRWVDDATRTVQEKTYGQFVEDIRKMTRYLQANVADVKGQPHQLRVRCGDLRHCGGWCRHRDPEPEKDLAGAGV